MAKVIIACGGTGGHLAPGIAVGQELQEKKHDVILLVSRKQVDSRLSQQYTDLTFKPMSGAAFSVNPVGLFRFVFSQTRSLVSHLKLMLSQKPDVVLAFGGFTSLGCVLAACFMRIPIALHEANRKPGKATRLFRHFAKRIYLPDGLRIKGERQNKVRYLGYPLRKGFVRHPREEARRHLGIEGSGKVLVVLGGSQGAQSLNEWVDNNGSKLALQEIQIYCLTGMGKSEERVCEYTTPQGKKCQIHFVPFTDEMDWVLSSADLAVSRAGAGAIAEMQQCLLPSILIPYPYAADDHQRANAAFCEAQGGALVLSQNQISNLYNEVCDLIFNDWMLERMRSNIRAVRKQTCAEQTVEDLLTLFVPKKVRSKESLLAQVKAKRK